MDLYTLTENFLADDVVDEYISAIWTERYSKAGDIQLVVPATLANIEKLAEDTYVALRGSKEVMQVATQSIDKGLMTVKGPSLIDVLNRRIAWFANPPGGDDDAQGLVLDYTQTAKPGELIADVVDQMVINTTPFGGIYATAELQWADEEIPGLSLGAVDASGVAERLTIPLGPLYDAIQPLAENKKVGISLYLDDADPITGFVLKFTTYQGSDRTSDQEILPLIRLTPELDSLTDVKEIRSIEKYKNVAYVWYNNTISIHYADPLAPIPEGLARRVLVLDAEGDPTGTGVSQTYGGRGASWSSKYVTPGDIAAFREQQAKNAFANYNIIRALDGQTSPVNDYQYGVDYGLGDIIELQNYTGTITKARVTEFIRSHDQNGTKEYPTVEVVE